MLYFSEIKNKKVVTEDGISVGRLDDLVFEFKEIPVITQLVISAEKYLASHKIFIPIDYFKKINRDIVITKKYMSSSLKENELYIGKNLIDKQIIDIEGRKVIRVNDVVIQEKLGEKFFIAGVDTSLVGMARWFGLDKLISKFLNFFRLKLKTEILPWSSIAPLELSQGKVLLNVKQERLSKINPEDLADYLETTSIKNLIKTINLLQYDYAADVVAELSPNYQKLLFRHLSPPKAAKLISLTDPDDAVDILSQFSEKRRDSILNLVTKEKRAELLNLFKLGETPIGKLLTTEFFSVKSDSTVKETSSLLKKESPDIGFLTNIYATGLDDQLVGFFSVRNLLLYPSDTPVYKFMNQNIIAATLTTPILIAFKKMVKYKLTSLPIIDNQKKILGIVTIDDVAEHFLNRFNQFS